MPDGDFEKETREAQPGITGRWGMTPNLTLGGTLNPDFSQVEADALQLDINEPFALYYDEKRPFFTEGADFFTTLERAVYTRTMRDPDWGLKLTGKEGSNTVGTYVVRDELTNLIFSGSRSSRSTSLPVRSTASVFRYKRDIGNKYTLGGLFTDREGDDYYNRVGGFDGDFLLTPTDQVQIQILRSNTRYPGATAAEFDQPGGSFNDELLSFEYDHNTRSMNWWFDYEQAGPGFRADLGFIPQVGYRNAEGGLFYEWTAKPGKWWSRMWAGNEINYFEDTAGNPFDRRVSLWYQFNGAKRSDIYSILTFKREEYLGKEFDLTCLSLDGGFWATGDFQFYFWGRFGDRIDYANIRPGRRVLLNPYADYNLGKHMRFTIDHAFERMTVEGERLYTANISQLTAIYQLNMQMFFRSIFQYVDYRYNTDLYTFDIQPSFKHFFSQLLFSYKINPRTVFFVGYTDNHYNGRDFGLTRRDRTLFAKLGYAGLL